MKANRFTILAAMVICALMALADTNFSLLPPRTAVQGQKFSITFRLTNGQGSTPAAPEIPNCRLLFGPSLTTMSSTQIINGQMTSTSNVDYTFTYLAEKEGTVTIPAVSISVGGKQLSSATHTFKILPPDQNAQQQQGYPQAPNQGSLNDKDKIDPSDMFVRISLNRSSVYEQEAVVVSVKVYTRYEISSFAISAQPTFEGFLSEELDVPSGTELEHYNGKNYYTAYLKKCIVYPQKSGQLTITSGKYDVTLVDYELVSNGFFQTRRPVEKHVVTESNNAHVNVKSLPTPAPAGYSGAVGSFTASVKMNPTELRTNEAASYIYTVEGTGNIKYLKTPALDLPAGIDQYTPKTDINANFTGDDMRGTYSVNYTLVPQEPGKFEIPSSNFIYFNPADKEYHTIALQAFDIKVAQGAATSTVTEQKSIAKGMTDILHIKQTPESLSREPEYAFRNWGYWLLYLGCTIFLIVLIAVYRRQLRLNADIRGRKLAKANSKANKRLKSARYAMERNESEKFYAELNKAMWGYLSDKLDIPASQLLRDNIGAKLTEYGLDAQSVDNTISILDECEMARFTPQHSHLEMSQIYSQAANAIKSIESVKH